MRHDTVARLRAAGPAWLDSAADELETLRKALHEIANGETRTDVADELIRIDRIACDALAALDMGEGE